MKTPHIYGYARKSPSTSLGTSIEVQTSMIRERAERLDGEWQMVVSDENVSGRTVPFAERRGGRDLMNVLRKGDKLIVTRLDRLARSLKDMIDICDMVANRGISLYVLDFGGGELQMDSALGRLLVHLLAVIGEYHASLTSERNAETHAFRRANGLASGHPRYGRMTVRRKQGDGTIVKLDVWDPVECELIKEIHRRVDKEGASVHSVAVDFMERGLLTRRGKPWAKRKPNGQIKATRVYTVLAMYRKILAEGGDIG